MEGVTLYVVPAAKPVWLQYPLLSVHTEPGADPVPEMLKVILTPEIPVPVIVVTLPEALKGRGGEVITNTSLMPFIAELDVLITTTW